MYYFSEFTNEPHIKKINEIKMHRTHLLHIYIYVFYVDLDFIVNNHVTFTQHKKQFSSEKCSS